MRARLLLNIGVVLEHLGTFHRAIEFLQKAINICKSHDLYNLLYQCYITEGFLHSHKQKDNAKALSLFNLALDVAGRLDNKVIIKPLFIALELIKYNRNLKNTNLKPA